MQQRLKEIGINVDLSVADWPTVSKIGFTDQGWHFWTHGYGIEPYEGPASVMAPWVNGTSQRKKDETIDKLATSLNAEMDEAKRKQLFTQFQTHMYDNAVAMKAGNYGHLPDRDCEAEELHALSDPPHVGRDARALIQEAGRGCIRPRPQPARAGDRRC